MTYKKRTTKTLYSAGYPDKSVPVSGASLLHTTTYIFILHYYNRNLIAVLWIRIRVDPELLPGSGIKVPDPDPAKSERAYK